MNLEDIPESMVFSRGRHNGQDGVWWGLSGTVMNRFSLTLEEAVDDGRVILAREAHIESSYVLQDIIKEIGVLEGSLDSLRYVSVDQFDDWNNSMSSFRLRFADNLNVYGEKAKKLLDDLRDSMGLLEVKDGEQERAE